MSLNIPSAAPENANKISDLGQELLTKRTQKEIAAALGVSEEALRGVNFPSAVVAIERLANTPEASVPQDRKALWRGAGYEPKVTVTNGINVFADNLDRKELAHLEELLRAFRAKRAALELAAAQSKETVAAAAKNGAEKAAVVTETKAETAKVEVPQGAPAKPGKKEKKDESLEASRALLAKLGVQEDPKNGISAKEINGESAKNALYTILGQASENSKAAAKNKDQWVAAGYEDKGMSFGKSELKTLNALLAASVDANGLAKPEAVAALKEMGARGARGSARTQDREANGNISANSGKLPETARFEPGAEMVLSVISHPNFKADREAIFRAMGLTPEEARKLEKKLGRGILRTHAPEWGAVMETVNAQARKNPEAVHQLEMWLRAGGSFRTVETVERKGEKDREVSEFDKAREMSAAVRGDKNSILAYLADDNMDGFVTDYSATKVKKGEKTHSHKENSLFDGLKGLPEGAIAAAPFILALRGAESAAGMTAKGETLTNDTTNLLKKDFEKNGVTDLSKVTFEQAAAYIKKTPSIKAYITAGLKAIADSKACAEQIHDAYLTAKNAADAEAAKKAAADAEAKAAAEAKAKAEKEAADAKAIEEAEQRGYSRGKQEARPTDGNPLFVPAIGKKQEKFPFPYRNQEEADKAAAAKERRAAEELERRAEAEKKISEDLAAALKSMSDAMDQAMAEYEFGDEVDGSWTKVESMKTNLKNSIIEGSKGDIEAALRRGTPGDLANVAEYLRQFSENLPKQMEKRENWEMFGKNRIDAKAAESLRTEIRSFADWKNAHLGRQADNAAVEAEPARALIEELSKKTAEWLRIAEYNMGKNTAADRAWTVGYVGRVITDARECAKSAQAALSGKESNARLDAARELLKKMEGDVAAIAAIPLRAKEADLADAESAKSAAEAKATKARGEWRAAKDNDEGSDAERDAIEKSRQAMNAAKLEAKAAGEKVESLKKEAEAIRAAIASAQEAKK